MPDLTHTLVCPFNEELITYFGRRQLVVNVQELDHLISARQVVEHSGNHLRCVRLFLPGLLAELPAHPDITGIPLALYVRGAGPFARLAHHLSWLRALDLRVFLALNEPEDYVAARILASLGVPTTVVPETAAMDWEALADLAAYALLGRGSRAPLEPFFSMSANFQPTALFQAGPLYFQDPARFLHLSAEGRVALSEADLAEGRFVADHCRELESVPHKPAYQERLRQWREPFLRFEGCSVCPAWRSCLGWWGRFAADHRQCREFVTELMDLLERRARSPRREKQLWQL